MNLIVKIEMLKLIVQPVRIAILDELSKGVKCITDLQNFFEVRQSNISQNLSAFRHSDFIDYFIDRRLRCYFRNETMMLAKLTLFYQ